ncbi:MAG: diguanylate cyclase [Methyloprofundus sp.]|nr:diguanylate cyclase [Methyloprofundus sp.]
MNDIDMMMNRVFKKERAIVEKSKIFIERKDVSCEELQEEYTQLLDAYQSLLNESSKITKIGDINQRKLFDANSEVESQKEKLYKLSITDYLTGCYNRRYILEALEVEFMKSKRYSFSLSCILIDIDDFKRINDIYGHQVGDFTLKTVSEIIQDVIREVDVFGRYGGEEFLIILPNTQACDAAIVAEKVRKKIAQLKFETGSQEVGPFMLTLSLGISDTHSGNPKTVEELLCHTDKALYQAKDKHKNQYAIYP